MDGMVPCKFDPSKSYTPRSGKETFLYNKERAMNLLIVGYLTPKEFDIIYMLCFII